MSGAVRTAIVEAMNIQNKPPHEPPRRIQVDKRDNVAIVVNGLGLPAGTEFSDGLVLNHFVPQGHKVALADIADGGNIVRYGEVIGTAVVLDRNGNPALGIFVDDFLPARTLNNLADLAIHLNALA